MSIKAAFMWFVLVAGFFIAARIPQHKHNKHKEGDVVVIEGKVFPLVVDDFDNWYIKQPIDSVRSIYVPANFETEEDESDN
jgi:hypothetical protein